MLRAAVRVVSVHGYEGMSVGRVADGARVSRRTFYDVFQSREDCFVAAFEDGLARAARCVGEGYGAGGDWAARVRGALMGLLGFFGEEPQVASLLVVDALSAGSRVLERRAEVLRTVSARLQADGVQASRSSSGIAPLTGEGVVGGVLGVLHARLSERAPQMLGLTSQLTGMVVLPYLGQRVAARELARSVPVHSGGSGRRAGSRVRGKASSSVSLVSTGVDDPLVDLPMRLTYRTLRVLGAIAEWPGASNRVIGEVAEAYDQGQISKLLSRLEKLGLVQNTAGGGHRPTGEPNAWRLTSQGVEVERALRVDGGNGTARRGGARGNKVGEGT
jgi:AcrR family transcriptional regulator